MLIQMLKCYSDSKIHSQHHSGGTVFSLSASCGRIDSAKPGPKASKGIQRPNRDEICETNCVESAAEKLVVIIE